MMVGRCRKRTYKTCIDGGRCRWFFEPAMIVNGLGLNNYLPNNVLYRLLIIVFVRFLFCFNMNLGSAFVDVIRCVVVVVAAVAVTLSPLFYAVTGAHRSSNINMRTSHPVPSLNSYKVGWINRTEKYVKRRRLLSLQTTMSFSITAK